MSSSAYINFEEEIPLADWTTFCEEHSIRYNPNTIGQSTFYGGSTEIQLTPDGSVDKDERGYPIWSTALPPERISRMTVRTFYQGDLDSVG